MRPMPIIRLVRHAEPAASWGDHPDPGLSDTGRDQARSAADLLRSFGPKPIVTSPLARCRETAAPLAALWACAPSVSDAVAEITTPPGVADRPAWLRAAMTGRWRDLGAELAVWRMGVASALLALQDDVVVFSHFVAINAAVGAALEDDRVLVFQPAHASITILSTDGGRLRLIDLGRQLESNVL
jgi:broad specificity phosphatase PhoE